MICALFCVCYTSIKKFFKFIRLERNNKHIYIETNDNYYLLIICYVSDAMHSCFIIQSPKETFTVGISLPILQIKKTGAQEI